MPGWLTFLLIWLAADVASVPIIWFMLRHPPEHDLQDDIPWESS